MSLFDKLKNKITEEKRKQRDNSYLFDDDKDSPKNNKKPKIETGTYNYSKNKNITSSPRVKATGDILQSGSKPTASQKKTATGWAIDAFTRARCIFGHVNIVFAHNLLRPSLEQT